MIIIVMVVVITVIIDVINIILVVFFSGIKDKSMKQKIRERNA